MRPSVTRVADYLCSFPVVPQLFEWKSEQPAVVTVWTDSDWATCETTRRSRSGGVVMLAGVPVEHWCRTQDRIALSSAEAELKASCKGISAGLGIWEAAKFLTNRQFQFEHFTDASANLGIIKRKGAGSIKHLSARQLWVQEIMDQPNFSAGKVARADNPADLLCSTATVWETQRNLERLQLQLPHAWPFQLRQGLQECTMLTSQLQSKAWL